MRPKYMRRKYIHMLLSATLSVAAFGAMSAGVAGHVASAGADEVVTCAASDGSSGAFVICDPCSVGDGGVTPAVPVNPCCSPTDGAGAALAPIDCSVGPFGAPEVQIPPFGPRVPFPDFTPTPDPGAPSIAPAASPLVAGARFTG